jgi:hypothetical protein
VDFGGGLDLKGTPGLTLASQSGAGGKSSSLLAIVTERACSGLYSESGDRLNRPPAAQTR